MPTTDDPTYIKVTTTRPQNILQALEDVSPIRTARLLLRPLVLSDLEAFQPLHTQARPQSLLGYGRRPSRDLAESRKRLEHRQTGLEQFAFGIFLLKENQEGKEEEEEEEEEEDKKRSLTEHFWREWDDHENSNSGGHSDDDKDDVENGRKGKEAAEATNNKTPSAVECELIGHGGINVFTGYWPSVWYVLKREHWGNGYASEFLEAVLRVWWELPREVVQVRCLARRHALHCSSSSSPSGSGVFVDADAAVAPEPDPAGAADTAPPHHVEMLQASVTRSNLRSQRVVEKAGFEFCGEERKSTQDPRAETSVQRYERYLCWLLRRKQ